MRKTFVLLAAAVVLAGLSGICRAEDGVVRLGIVGLDTSHVVVFTKAFNDESNPDRVPGIKVVAGFKGGSPDIPSSINRVEGYTKELTEKWGVKLYDSVEELCKNVDGVLIENVDGRPHLEEAKIVIAAGLPFFVDKPIAGTYEDVVEIAKLAKKAGVPWFGGSSLRWWYGLKETASPEKVGEVLGCDAMTPCELEPHHPDMFWYGVHGVSILYGVMGPGCKQVTRVSTPDTDFVVGVWDDGRVGTVRGTRKGKYDLSARVMGTKANAVTESNFSYQGLIDELAKFFKTKKAPIAAEELVEQYAFMQCADLSKEQGGKPVEMPEISLD